MLVPRASAVNAASPAVPEATCYHCGSPQPPSSRWRARVGGSERAFCCAGCLAIAQTLDAGGHAGFYASRGRVVFPRAVEAVEDDVRIEADAIAASQWITTSDVGNREASLMIEGMRCTACAWLIETWIARKPGVVAFRINYTTGRARVAWREPDASLRAILGWIAELGYGAQPYDPAQRESLAIIERRSLLLRASIATLLMMQVMMLAIPAYFSVDGVAPEHRALLEWASLVLTLPAVTYAAWPFLHGALRDLRNRQLGMDVPVALGIAAAFVASASATLAFGGPVYYDSITMFVALLLIARYCELAGRQRAGAAIERLARARPLLAERIRSPGDAAEVDVVPSMSLRAGERVLVRGGAIVPADGRVVEGCSHVEEALLTGESWPRRKAIGDAVLAGSVNRESALVIRVTAAGEETRLSSIMRLVDAALCERPAIARLADRVAAVFVVSLLALAVVTALAWWQIDPSRAFEITLALFVVSCPCALSLATPSAMTAALGALSARQVLVASPDALAALASVTHVVFDKTGTLTMGRVGIRAQFVYDASAPERARAIAAALEARSEHPIAGAFAAAAGPGPAPAAEDLVAMTGAGIEGRVKGRRYRIGRESFVRELCGAFPPDAVAHAAAAAQDVSLVYLGSEEGPCALFLLGDALRAEARATVAALVARGVAPILLSGDRESAARATGAAIGIRHAQGELSPEAKREAIVQLQAAGGVVAMIGDGVNDAPGLAQAQVSITFGAATDLAKRTSDIVILSDRLTLIDVAIGHARRSMRIVRQNLGWAFAYNAIAIPATAFGLVTPLMAAAGMSLSSLAVVVNALRAARLVAAQEGTRDADEPVPAPARA